MGSHTFTVKDWWNNGQFAQKGKQKLFAALSNIVMEKIITAERIMDA